MQAILSGSHFDHTAFLLPVLVSIYGIISFGFLWTLFWIAPVVVRAGCIVCILTFSICLEVHYSFEIILFNNHFLRVCCVSAL